MSAFKKVAITGLVGAIALCIAAPAVGKSSNKPSKPAKARPAVTKIVFHIDDHSVAPGDAVTGTAVVWTRQGKQWVAFSGAALDVSLDGTVVGTVAADAAGVASVSVGSLDEGAHVVKVTYAGDAVHRKAQRAQGFEVTTTPDEPVELEDGTGV